MSEKQKKGLPPLGPLLKLGKRKHNNILDNNQSVPSNLNEPLLTMNQKGRKGYCENVYGEPFFLLKSQDVRRFHRIIKTCTQLRA